MKTETEINKLAAEAMGICFHETSDEYPDWSEPHECKHCDMWIDASDVRNAKMERQKNDFCADLNAAQKLVTHAKTLEVAKKLRRLLGYSDEAYSDDITEDVLRAPPKTITLAALVALGKITLEEAKEVRDEELAKVPPYRVR